MPSKESGIVRRQQSGLLVAELARRWVGQKDDSQAVLDLCASYQEVRVWLGRQRVMPWCVPFALHLWRVVEPGTSWWGNTSELEKDGGRLLLEGERPERGDVLYSRRRGHAAVYVGRGEQVEGNNAGRCVLVPLERWPSVWRPW